MDGSPRRVSGKPNANGEEDGEQANTGSPELVALMSPDLEDTAERVVIISKNMKKSLEKKVAIKKDNNETESKPSSSWQSAGFISRTFFLWLYPIIWVGRKRPLQVADIPSHPYQDDSQLLGEQFQKAWSEQVNKHGLPNASLLRTLLSVYGCRYVTLGFVALFEECVLRIGQPLLLGYLMRYFGGEFSTIEGYLFASGVILLSAWYVTQHHPFFFALQHNGMKMRISVASLLYQKILVLDPHNAEGVTTQGQIQNLLSNDVNRLDLSKDFMHYIWIAPIQLAIVIYILWGYFGWTCLSGVGILILFLPFQMGMGKLFGKLRAQVVLKTDSRLRITNEVLKGIKAIKCYTWEKLFTDRVTGARNEEIRILKRTAFLRAINQSLYYVSSKIAIFITLLVYVVLGNQLTAEKVFVTLALYSNVRMTLTLFLPYGISQLAEVLVSIKRLQTFLRLPERISVDQVRLVLSHDKELSDDQVHGNEEKDRAIEIDNLTTQWNNTSSDQRECLSHVSLSVQKGELVALIGATGAGKSSMLQVLLGELPPKSGTFTLSGKLAYFAQEPWIFSGTVRENIVFGKEEDPEWYAEVVQKCCLQSDFKLLPNGDQTFVGESGTALSGGQKARVALARAVYSQADINLLDDPFSAVDARVGRQLFDSCIKEMLKEKTVLLVTHQHQFLDNVDRIVVISDGKIQEQGTIEKIVKAGLSLEEICVSDEEGTRAEKEIDTESRHANGNIAITSSVQSNVEQVAEVSSEMTLYWKYIQEGSNWFTLTILVFTNILAQVLYSGSDYWLKYWTKTEQSRSVVSSTETKGSDLSGRPVQITIYGIIIAGLFIFSFGRTISFFSICMKSSVNLHQKMFTAVISAPMKFFEVNPSGRILNRCAKDVGMIDDALPLIFFDTIEVALQVLGILIVVSIVNPLLLIPSTFVCVSFHFIRNLYLKTSQAVKRLESAARSPVFSHVSTTMNGLPTIRTFQSEKQFVSQFVAYQNQHSSAWFLSLATARWLGITVDWVSTVYIAVVTFILMISNQGGTEVGLAISSAMALTGLLQWGVKQSAETANQIVAVERVVEYMKVKPEGSGSNNSCSTLEPTDWPSEGEIDFDDVTLCYGDNSKPTLKGISTVIKPGEKIGIVGRTGAGKSSIISAILRLVEIEPTGKIQIDGVNTRELELKALRRRISIIPQEPFLFEGTLRSNMDPFSIAESDAKLWQILEDVHFKEFMKNSPLGLDTQIPEGGAIFSVGQKQLICLARAILAKNKILILDEATANLDGETDGIIQTTIRKQFQDCTVLTVAHRLQTVMDSDKILVLDKGSVQEFDEPYQLLSDKSSALSQLVNQTGDSSAQALFQLAKEAHDKLLVQS